MKIKITSVTDLNARNAALACALALANGKASAHIARLTDLIDAAADAERQLAALGLPPSRRAGAQASHVSGGSVPNSYRYPRRVTYSTLTRGRSDWFLTFCTSADAWPSVDGGTSVMLPASADEYLVAKFRDRYSVIRPTILPTL
jgi:hypothetical protein